MRLKCKPLRPGTKLPVLIESEGVGSSIGCGDDEQLDAYSRAVAQAVGQVSPAVRQYRRQRWRLTRRLRLALCFTPDSLV